jgi:hypothetical protein
MENGGNQHGNRSRRNRSHLLLHDFDQDELAGPHEIAKQEQNPVAKTLSREHSSSWLT